MIPGLLTNVRVSIYLRASRARIFDRAESKGNRLVLRAPSGVKLPNLNQFPFDKSSGDAGRRQIFHWPSISLSTVCTYASLTFQLIGTLRQNFTDENRFNFFFYCVTIYNCNFPFKNILFAL